jgi:hypothetical protein
MNMLPALIFNEFRPTRDYLQDICKVLGKLQQAFLPTEPHGWQYGLDVTMRGVCTQTFDINGQPERALLDLVRHKVRFIDRQWTLCETPPAELFKDIQNMLGIEIDELDLKADNLEYDHLQADAYAAALWWMERQFANLKRDIKRGLASPILLYPHHFDLSLTCFPQDDEGQLSIGWSTGDENIAEPYIYLTKYPNTENNIPAILTYAKLQKSLSPPQLLRDFAAAFRID